MPSKRTARKTSRRASVASDDLDAATTPASKVTSSRRTSTAGTKSTTTPATSIDGDEDHLQAKSSLLHRTAKMEVSTTSVRGGKKRPRLSSEELALESNDIQTAVDNISLSQTSPSNESTDSRGTKRRKVRPEVWVEIASPFTTPGKAKGKGKAKQVDSIDGSGSRKVSRTSRRTSVTAYSNDELVDGSSELDYDEMLDEEPEDSDDEGSVFEVSDSDEAKLVGSRGSTDDSEFEEVTPLRMRTKTTARRPEKRARVASPTDEIDLLQVAAADDDEEAAMLRLAIEASLSSPRKTADSARPGSSSRKSAHGTTKKGRRGTLNVDDDFSDQEPPSDELSALSSSEGSFDGGGFIKQKGKKAAKSTVKQRQGRKGKDTPPSTARSIVRQEAQRLGRKLTYAERTNALLRVFHPELKDVWGDLERAIKPAAPEKAPQPPGLKATLLPFQQESLFWMRKQEQSLWKGGCLADEMGMGKTIQTLALLSGDRRKPNLIVAPTVAIMQWKNEIDAHTEGFKVTLFHGSAREKDAAALKSCDVVLTTYSVLESCFRRQHTGFSRKGTLIKEKSVLHAFEWARVVLDEAHNIKERSCNTAKAAFELQAKYRWCLSGTPLQNRVGELYSLVRFLGGDPFSYYFCKVCPCKSLHWAFSDKRSCDSCGHTPMNHTCYWNNEILTPIQKHAVQGPGQVAFKKLKILLDRMMLRRTKLERADDLGLPPRTVIVRRDYFSPEEKELYHSLFSDAHRQFSTYVNAGTVLNNYSNIFSLITRMRQMACHPDLVLKSKTNQEFSADVVEAAICRLCNDIAEDAIKSRCHHLFDRECIKQYIVASGDTPSCPVCHVPLSIDLDAPALEQDEEVVNKARQGILGRLDFDGWRSSTKIEALIEELSNLRREDRTTKSIVFSQFVNFLDLIAWRLQRAGFNICRLEGSMTPAARDLTIKHFMNNVEVTVFLVSLKAGGVALNLVEASRVYLMDSWWNPAVEYQAMDRIHRLGQHRPVQAIKLVVEDSIESRIVELQETKLAMVDATLSNDDSAMGRLTPEDLGFLFRL
ncbi:DNA repair protein rad16 [Tulasnella sp. 403]|nr:DNA repair protein rad16 [Tulasnella sp. 403]